MRVRLSSINRAGEGFTGSTDTPAKRTVLIAASAIVIDEPPEIEGDAAFLQHRARLPYGDAGSIAMRQLPCLERASHAALSGSACVGPARAAAARAGIALSVAASSGLFRPVSTVFPDGEERLSA